MLVFVGKQRQAGFFVDKNLDFRKNLFIFFVITDTLSGSQPGCRDKLGCFCCEMVQGVPTIVTIP